MSPHQDKRILHSETTGGWSTLCGCISSRAILKLAGIQAISKEQSLGALGLPERGPNSHSKQCGQDSTRAIPIVPKGFLVLLILKGEKEEQTGKRASR